MPNLRWRLPALALLFALALSATSSMHAAPAATSHPVYLPMVAYQPPLRRINAPHFTGAVPIERTAIFWYGKVNQSENYTDVRVGYNDSELLFYLAIFDRSIWYDTSPADQDLNSWDTISLYLDTGKGDVPLGASARRFDAQFNGGGSRDKYQAAYRGSDSGWVRDTTAFTTLPGWRGDTPNNDGGDRGWAMTYHIPFSSLGLSSPPAPGTTWRLALVTHDRDSAAGPPLPDKAWPEALSPDSPHTWGDLVFGLPTYTPPKAAPGGIVTIRHKLNGATVIDNEVGGSTVCGGGLNFWTQWGDANYTGKHYVNVQNQADVADWPCFSKVYFNFPLSGLPPGKAIISATLELRHFGNSGEGSTPLPTGSLIQVSIAGEDWKETAITWNNAPLAEQNIGASWVPFKPIGAPDVTERWDVSLAVAQAYAKGQPLRLILYTPDTQYSSGKYFYTSELDDWGATARPTVKVQWGDPAP